MKKINFLIGLIVFLFIGIVLFQNRQFFLSTESLSVNLGFFQYRSPDAPVGLLFCISFFVGIIIAYFFSLTARFNAQKTIKNLTAALDSQREKLKSPEDHDPKRDDGSNQKN